MTPTPATFDDLDLNDQYARENIYYDRVRKEFEGVSDEDVIAQAWEIARWKTDSRWSAVSEIARHRIKIARQVEPKMETFRKVCAGWYTLAIVSFDEVMQEIKDRVPEADRRVEEHIDVSRNKHGDGWIISTRGGKNRPRPMYELNQDSLFSEGVSSLAEGKRYAVTLKAYLTNKGPNPDWLLRVFSNEQEAAHRAKIEAQVGMPYDEWEAKIMGRSRA